MDRDQRSYSSHSLSRATARLAGIGRVLQAATQRLAPNLSLVVQYTNTSVSSGSLRATFSGQLAAKKVRVDRQHTVVSRDFTTINLQTTVCVGREVDSVQRATSVRERVHPDWCVISIRQLDLLGLAYASILCASRAYYWILFTAKR